MNALIMYDRQTRSLWSHFLSEGIEGEYKGVKLTNVPLVLTTWEEWRTSFPETKALLKGESSFDPYTTYYMRGDAGVIGESNRDERLYGKEIVLGAGFDDGAIAFPAYRSARRAGDQYRDKWRTCGRLLRIADQYRNCLLQNGRR